MPLFIWKPSYELGIPEIDLDHRKLVGMINELYEAIKQAHGHELIGQTIDRLLEYAHRHFDTEESFMRASRYPGIEAHESEHQAFREQVKVMAARCCEGKCPPTIEMMNFLRDWLRDHVTTTDKELGKYLKRIQS